MNLYHKFHIHVGTFHLLDLKANFGALYFVNSAHELYLSKLINKPITHKNVVCCSREGSASSKTVRKKN